MQKAYSPINWEDYPSEATPINEENLNRMDNALNEIDNRVLNHDNTKANTADVLTMIDDVSFDETKGVFTFTRKNGSKITLDTKLEKIAINWSYDALAQVLIITLDDGTKQEISLSALINEYDFNDTDTIAFTVIGGEVTAVVKDGSINENHLNPNYLAEIKLEVANAQAQAQNSATFAGNSSNSATKSESYAHGGTGTRENEDVDNAKYYYEQAKHISQGGNGLVPLGTIAFENLPTQDILTNGMYNISNDFVSDERFVDGGGVAYGKGSNVYYTATGYWDVLAASSVTGVRGSAETAFRQGNVTITPDNLGMGGVLNDIESLMSKIGNVGGLNAKMFNRTSDEGFSSTISNVDDIPVGYMGYVYTSMGAKTEGLIFCYGMHTHGYRVQLNTSLYGGGTYIRYLSDTTWSEWKKLSSEDDLAKYLPLTGGTLDGIVTMNKQLRIAGGISPTSDNSQLLGSGSFAWANVVGRIHSLYSNNINYGSLEIGAEGTESTVGYSRLTLGNNKAGSTKGNAQGFINLYGYGTGLTSLGVSNNGAENITVKLPKTNGTLMLKENIYIDDDGYVVIDFDK